MATADWTKFANFMGRVDDAKRKLNLRDHQECFYRGHQDKTWELVPSLYRTGGKRNDGQWIKLERRVFFEFKTRARQLYGSENSDWDILFHMQHHGVPTRLLDWTSMFGVALYFALLKYVERLDHEPCIWLLNPYELNQQQWGQWRLYSPKYLARREDINRSYDYSELLLGTNGGITWTRPIGIYSLQRSDRMAAQSGWFTIHGSDRRPVDQIVGPDLRDSTLQRVVIQPDEVPAAKEFLQHTGMTHRQLFPDLDGLARSICDKFELNLRPVRG